MCARDDGANMMGCYDSELLYMLAHLATPLTVSGLSDQLIMHPGACGIVVCHKRRVCTFRITDYVSAQTFSQILCRRTFASRFLRN